MELDKKLSSLQEVSKAQLSKILSSVVASKYLVLEPSIIRPLERVCGVQWLKGNGVEKIFKLESVVSNFGESPVFYMIFSSFGTFKQVVDQIRSQINQESPPKNRFHVIVVPRYFSFYQQELEELGLIHTVIRLYSFQWFPIYLDNGILSLELPNIYKSVFLQHDYGHLPVLSKALWKLSLVIGMPKFILALGDTANKILQQVDVISEDKGESDKVDADVGCLLIIDRNLDYPSALLTPGTYSALLSEVYGVSAGICEYKEKEDEGQNPKMKKQPISLTLNSNQDSVYAQIKNFYFTEVTSVLSSLTKELKSEKIQSKEMALDEIKRYVQTQLQVTKSRKKFIANHLQAAETIINVLGPRYESQLDIEGNILRDSSKSASLTYLENSLSIINDKNTCLRLFCLICVTQKVTESEVRSFWRKFLHQFGYSYGSAHKYLISANFISETSPHFTKQNRLRLPKFTVKEFYGNAAKFKQIPPNSDKINLKFPTCASYVFGGSYIPLVTQISSMLLNATPIDEIKTKLSSLGSLTLRNDKAFPLQSRSVLIYMIGGITYAEIAACNLLETLTGSKIVVLSDRIITGNVLMEDVLS